MNKEILLIQHTDVTTPGVIWPWLEQSQTTFHHIKLQNGESLPVAKPNQSVILCGGGLHIDQEHLYPFLTAEKKWIEEQIKLGNKILGLCLGAQLCAQVLGAKVYPHSKGWEVGWWDVTLHQTAGLKGFEETKNLSFSQYHRYIFETPDQAEVIASNAWWPAQGYLWNRQVLGLQFHPERNLHDNRECALEKDLPNEGHTQTAEQILTHGEAHQPLAAKWFEQILKGFLI